MKYLEKTRLDENQREVQAVYDKYEQQIQIAIEGEERKDEYSKAFHERRLELEQLRNEEINQLKEEQENEFFLKQKEAREKWLEESLTEQEQQEMELLRVAYQNKLLKVEEYELARTRIQLKYQLLRKEKEKAALEKEFELYKNHVQKQQHILDAFGEYFSTQKDLELQIAGDNEEKKKEVMKKYADIEFAVKVGQIIASTALAIIQAFAQLGPYAGAVAAIVIGATGALQLSLAQMQRNKVKGYSKGRYNVIGKDDNKLYRDVPYIGKPQTGFLPPTPALISETGREGIVTYEDLQNPVIANLFNQIRYHAKVKQHAEGNYPETQTQTATVATKDQLTAEVHELRKAFLMYATKIDDWATALEVYLSLTELENKQNRIKRVKTLGGV